ncbi:hypothetical protein [Prauserella flavalba]|uniref:hypothetical protein n=1 Tax=Prauserella flavalba TaxID=1477506 RepID=UPI0036E123FB
MAVRFTAIRWAREVPTLLHQNRVDRLGHHLLLLLATYARNDGSDVRTSPTTLAREVHAPERDVVAALARLEAAELIERAPGSNGAPGWALNLDARSEVDTVIEDRAARRRAKDRERQRRRRERLTVAGHAGVGRDRHARVERDVTQNSTVTEAVVTHDSTVSHGQVVRDKADVTQELCVSHASETVTTAGQHGCNSLRNSQKKNSQEELPPVAAATESTGVDIKAAQATLIPFPVAEQEPARKPTGYTEAFEAAWTAYGRKGAKKTAFAEWQRAIKRADITTITAAIPPYVASRPELKYRKDFERWLKGDCWESAVVPAAAAASSHRPYRNPADTAAYYEDL